MGFKMSSIRKTVIAYVIARSLSLMMGSFRRILANQFPISLRSHRRDENQIANITIESVTPKTLNKDMMASVSEALTQEFIATIIANPSPDVDHGLVQDTIQSAVSDAILKSVVPLSISFLSLTLPEAKEMNMTRLGKPRLKFRPLIIENCSYANDIPIANFFPGTELSIDRGMQIEDSSSNSTPNEISSMQVTISVLRYVVVPLIAHSFAHAAPSVAVHHISDNLRHVFDAWNSWAAKNQN